MFEELIHRLASKKLFAGLVAAHLASALILIAMFANKDAVATIVQWVGGPAFAALAYFVHAQGKVDEVETKSQSAPPSEN